MTNKQLEVKASSLLQGKSFEELVSIWNGLQHVNNPTMNELIMDQMEIVNAEKFEQWLEM